MTPHLDDHWGQDSSQTRALPLWQDQESRAGGVQKSSGHKVSWKTGVLSCHPVTSRPPTHVPAERTVLSPCGFETARLTVFILNLLKTCLLVTLRPTKWRTLSQRTKVVSTNVRMPNPLGVADTDRDMPANSLFRQDEHREGLRVQRNSCWSGATDAEAKCQYVRRLLQL